MTTLAIDITKDGSPIDLARILLEDATRIAELTQFHATQLKVSDNPLVRDYFERSFKTEAALVLEIRDKAQEKFNSAQAELRDAWNYEHMKFQSSPYFHLFDQIGKLSADHFPITLDTVAKSAINTSVTYMSGICKWIANGWELERNSYELLADRTRGGFYPFQLKEKNDRSAGSSLKSDMALAASSLDHVLGRRNWDADTSGNVVRDSLEALYYFRKAEHPEATREMGVTIRQLPGFLAGVTGRSIDESIGILQVHNGTRPVPLRDLLSTLNLSYLP